jgi:hypothetical protein
VQSQEEARLDALFAALDLARPDMAGVKARLDAGDRAGAARALMAHYRQRSAPGWLGADYRRHAPDSGGEAAQREKALAALGDTFTFQGVTGTAPRLPDGRLDWDHRGPRNDREWALFFNRHFLLLPLLHEHLQTKDPALARYADHTIADWVRSRPMEEAPEERMISPAWQPMSSASRLLQAWPHAFFGFMQADGFTDETRLLMLSSVPEQAAHLKKHHRKRHNHTIKEMAGLAHAAAVWPEFKDAPDWRRYAIETLSQELERQFYPDGVHQELSAHYHRSALQYYEWLKDFEAAGERPLPDDFAARIETAADYLARSMNPQGLGPLNNNGDLDDNRERVGDLAQRFSRADWRFIATGGAEGVAPQRLSNFYPWAGQAFLRDGFGADAQFAFFDLGPWGAAHQHNDKLNLTLSAYGRELLSDGGRTRYESSDPYVAHLRSTAGHNTLTIDGKNQRPDVRVAEAPLKDAFFSSPSMDFVRGDFTAGYEGLEGSAVHGRAIVYLRGGYWLVIDRIETDRPRTVQARWRFAPDAGARAQGGEAFTADPGLGNLRITPIGAQPTLSIVRGREAPDPLGWTSPDYNDRRAASVALYEFEISETGLVAWLLTPARDTPVAPRVRIVHRSADALTLRVGADVIAVRMAGSERLVLPGGRTSPATASVRRGTLPPVESVF